jgi:hypothetical protein
MLLFCASHIREREREKDTHQREREEKRASKLSASLHRRREGTRERKPIWIGKNRRSSPKGTREISERKTKAKKKKRYKTYSVFK